MSFHFIVTIDGEDQDLAESWRSEIAMSVQDAVDAGELPDVVTVGEVE